MRTHPLQGRGGALSAARAHSMRARGGTLSAMRTHPLQGRGGAPRTRGVAVPGPGGRPRWRTHPSTGPPPGGRGRSTGRPDPTRRSARNRRPWGTSATTPNRPTNGWGWSWPGPNGPPPRRSPSSPPRATRCPGSAATGSPATPRGARRWSCAAPNRGRAGPRARTRRSPATGERGPVAGVPARGAPAVPAAGVPGPGPGVGRGPGDRLRAVHGGPAAGAHRRPTVLRAGLFPDRHRGQFRCTTTDECAARFTLFGFDPEKNPRPAPAP